MTITEDNDGKRTINLKSTANSEISIVTFPKTEMEFSIEKFNKLLKEKGEEKFSRKLTRLDGDLTVKRSGEDYLVSIKKRKARFIFMNSEDSVVLEEKDFLEFMNEILFNFPKREIFLRNKNY